MWDFTAVGDPPTFVKLAIPLLIMDATSECNFMPHTKMGRALVGMPCTMAVI